MRWLRLADVDVEWARRLAHDDLRMRQFVDLRFRALVALNALGISEREMFADDVFVEAELKALRALLGAGAGPLPEARAGKEAEAWALRKQLAARIREGQAPAGTGAFLRMSVGNKLAIASPRFTSRYG